MARISRVTYFWKAFIITLLGGGFASAASRGEVEAWQAAVAQNTADAYYLYLSLYPAGEYVDEAIAALVRLGLIGPPRGIAPVVPVQGSPAKQTGGPYG